jgi:DNA replication initiation complex subunit (GINS family)
MTDENIVKKARDTLTALYRNEKSMKSLAPIPNEFFELVQSYLDQLHAEGSNAENLEPEIAESISRNIKLVHRRVKEIFSLRIEKIMGYAVIGSAPEEMENATAEDREIYGSIRELVEKYSHRAHRRSGIAAKGEIKRNPASAPAPQEPTNTPENETIRPSPADNGPAENDAANDMPPKPETHGTSRPDEGHSGRHGHPQQPARHDGDKMLIHAVEDIPPFTGLSRTFHLKKGDVSYIPTMIGKILVARGLAERIDSE